MARTPSTIINQNIIQNNISPVDTNKLLLISRRGTVRGADVLSPLDGINLYEVAQIPAAFYSSPSSLLSYFKNTVGAVVNTGIENTINLVAPDNVTTSTVNGQTFVRLTWNEEPYGWEDISGISLTGTASQTAADGTIYSVSSIGYVLTLTSVSGTFNTTDVVEVAYTNTSVTLPDGLATERFVLDAYYAVSALNGNASTINVTVTNPTIYLLLVSDRDGLFNPSATPFSLGAVDDVIENGDGSITLSWDTAPANWIYVPKSTVGSSSVEDTDTTGTGTFIEQLGPQYTPTGEGVAMRIQPAEGASFVAGNEIEMTLDSTFSILDVAKQNYYHFNSVNYELTASTDITSAVGDLYPFTQYLSAIRSPTSPQQGQYGTFGVVGMTTTTVTDLMTFGDIDNANYTIPFFYYQQMLGDAYIEGGQVAAAYAAILASNTAPYNNLDKFVLNGLPVSSNASSYITVGTDQDSETILDKGLTPIAVNAAAEGYIVRPITTQLTIPGSGSTDTEYYDMHAQQVLVELTYRTWLVSQLPQFQNTTITNILLGDMISAIYGMLIQAQTEGMIFDVSALASTITVEQDSTNPNQVNISYCVKISPALESQVYNIDLLSSLTTVSTAA